jgi:hypothetical protein
MSKNIVKIEALGEEEIVGRLIGFITDDECLALMNSDDAPKKVFTSESTTINENIGMISDRRFVVAVKNGSPSIFISPKIKSIAWISGVPELHCENNKAYKFTNEQDD